MNGLSFRRGDAAVIALILAAVTLITLAGAKPARA